jgi:hypothetical protein
MKKKKFMKLSDKEKYAQFTYYRGAVILFMIYLVLLVVCIVVLLVGQGKSVEVVDRCFESLCEKVDPNIEQQFIDYDKHKGSIEIKCSQKRYTMSLGG